MFNQRRERVGLLKESGKMIVEMEHSDKEAEERGKNRNGEQAHFTAPRNPHSNQHPHLRASPCHHNHRPHYHLDLA